MIRWTLYAFSWVFCVLISAAIFGQPEELTVQFRAWGVPGSVVDIFLANRGVQFVTGLSLTLVIGYGLPLAISGIMTVSRLGKTNDTIVAARHEQRSLNALEDLVLQNESLQASLSPVTHWATEQTGANGDLHVAARRKPSQLISANQLANDASILSNCRFLPKLFVVVTMAISLLILSQSADRAFAEILSVRGTDYGTMLLGLRSATAAMAIALLAALVVWALQIFFEIRTQKLGQDIVNGLDRLVIFDDTETMQLTMPIEPSNDAGLEQLLVRIAKNIEEKSHSKLNKIASDNDEKHLSLLAAVQQSMSELQSLRQDVDNIRGESGHELPSTANLPKVNKLTSAIRALKDSTASELPQL
jgi:hypothetical protein